MYTRRLRLPDRSFFLFGPRGTGKTTWLKSVLPDAKWFDLLITREILRLSRTPDLFRMEVESNPPKTWIVVDEIQRLPSLLNEVHAILFEHRSKYRFALTGSSARKLKRADVNLLAGRAINRKLFPLTAAELDFEFDLDDLLRFGCLPNLRMERKEGGQDSALIDLLEAYVDNYIREEIKQEALVKNLDSFSRFLEIAALMNARITNVSSISRDAAVARPTVQGYFDVLADTLIGDWLPAWNPRARVKEVKHPKFYFFDAGVVRALAGRLREPLDSAERGALLETYIFNELRAWIAYSNCGGQLSYWRTPAGAEVDFIWSRGQRAIGIESKASDRWRSEDGKPAKELLDSGLLKKAFTVYLGNKRLQDGPVPIFPVKDFLRELHRGRILG